jgi:hypothetical protein
MPDGKPLHCPEHKLATEQDLVSKTRCTVTGCRKKPLFGIIDGEPVHCPDHKTVIEVDVISRVCIAAGCHVKPTFGTQWSKPVHCLKHKLSNEEDVTRICKKTRRYGTWGDQVDEEYSTQPGQMCQKKESCAVSLHKPNDAKSMKTFRNQTGVLEKRCVATFELKIYMS